MDARKSIYARYIFPGLFMTMCLLHFTSVAGGELLYTTSGELQKQSLHQYNFIYSGYTGQVSNIRHARSLLGSRIGGGIYSHFQKGNYELFYNFSRLVHTFRVFIADNII